MTPGAVAERGQHIADVRADNAAGSASIKQALVAARQIEAWVQAQVAGLIGQLAKVESFPEATIAETAKCSLGQANRAKERSETLAATPDLAAALDDGAITSGHIDALTRASKQLDDEQRNELFERVEGLVDVAAAATIDQFGQRVRLEAKKLQRLSAEDRLERQRRNTRLSMWTDEEGMWNLRGRFDPVTGIKLSASIDNTVQALFAEQIPDLCPTDPTEKQKFLAAHALTRLLVGAGAGAGKAGRPEFVAVIDVDAPILPGADGPTVDWPIPVEVPGRVLAELTGETDVVAVVVRNGVVVHAPGELNLGRTTRLANRAQRRALRGLYRGCVIPGCSVSYDRCKLHHIVWWRNGGDTDLDNLLPVCSKHHGKIHHDNWVVELGPNRQLTLRLPDGSIHNTGPPHRRAA
jgi:hypothetical protein